ncbi:MAG: helix-turn-helix domain-containing protein [Bdellovibrionales bacterium]|nr:helix-turn-helix domain-containing protein [Bdellovibrionales bacterium]
MAVETINPGMNRDFSRDFNRGLNHETPYKGLVTSAAGGIAGERGMTPNLNSSDNLFVANLQAVSLEKLVKSKLEVLFQQQRDANIELSGLYDIVLEQVEKPLIELALQSRNGNQVKTAQLLGINRNTLKKKIDSYKIRIKRSSQKDV